MKRIKIMLTAIAVLTIAGGALAFKARKVGNLHYCYTTTRLAAATCPLSCKFCHFVAGPGKYTITNDPEKCREIPPTRCTSQGVFGGI